MDKLRNSFVRFAKGITVEPMFILYYVSYSIATFASSNLLLQKACHPGDTTAPDFSTACPDEIAAQKVITAIGYWRSILEYALPVLFIIFLGTWSDTHGKRRKPLMFVPLCGELVSAVFLMISSYWFALVPEITAGVLSTLRGVTGSTILFALGAITYISDITSLEDRSWRIGLITSLNFIASPLGSALSGILRKALGFFLLFLLCVVVDIVALVLGMLLMDSSAEEASSLGTFEGICDLSHFILSAKTLVRKRPGYNRVILWMMGLTAPLFISCFYGEAALLMFYTRNKFQMGESEYGLYSAYKLCTVFFGSFVAVLICSKWLKWSDEVIGALGNITQSVSAIAMCFAATTWQLYASPLLDLMHGAVFTAGRSLTSKVVEGKELGQVSSFFGVVDALVPIVVLPLYSAVYSLTLETLPGAFYLLSVSIAMVTFSLFVITGMLRRREVVKD